MTHALDVSHCSWLFLGLFWIDQAFTELFHIFASTHLYVASGRWHGNNMLSNLRASSNGSSLTSEILLWSIFIAKLLNISTIGLGELTLLFALSWANRLLLLLDLCCKYSSRHCIVFVMIGLCNWSRLQLLVVFLSAKSRFHCAFWSPQDFWRLSSLINSSIKTVLEVIS